jgi:hypothetical protein
VSSLTVGPGMQYATLAAAIAASSDGDVIQVQAGTYTNDFATINTKITIEGVGGMVNLVATAPPPNGKAILVTNTDVTLDNIAFSGAKVADGNGAGIRYQAGNLTINDCYFHNNQDGLLAADNPAGSITINNSEFAFNGTGDGFTHNLYVGKVGTLTINGSYFHDADVGHEIKSRALNTIIENSRISDGPTGTASYSIDLPDGGNVIIKNNIIEQGPKSQNPAIIHVGGPAYPGTNIQITNNTIINDLHSSSAVAVLNQLTIPVTLTGNDVYGLTSSQITKGPASVSGTTLLTSEPPLYTTHPWQVGTVPPDQLVAYLSESVAPGNAQFIISVDGKQLGAAQTVTASQPAGQAETFSFSGSFGPGSHTIAIDFSGDTGTAAQNLFVGGLDYDGQHYAADTATLSKGGVSTFSVFPSNVICYAAGTHILTATGERTVESLLRGDIVLALCGGELNAHPVEWVGRRRIDLTAHPRPETVAPVRIQRGAFAEDMPHKDLLVSPDHAIFVDGKLICARQLINGTTIRQEKDWSSVEYFHVELDAHAILLAEGLPAESYLNTGNRGFFANSGEPLVLHPDLTDEADYPAREAGSCAPFVSDEAHVRPVWQRLADRAAALGEPIPQVETTGDAELRVVAKGRTLRPLHSENGLHIFVLPRGATAARLVSRASAPTDSRPWLDDRRSLGVYVERIVLRGASEVHEVPVDHPSLSQGWWAVERNGTVQRRWTNGDAVLPLPVFDGPTMLEVHASGSGMTYVTNADKDRRAALVHA